MLIGNRKTFAIEIQPLSPTWKRSYLPERAAWSALSIWVSTENLCRNVLSGEEHLRAAVNVPLAPLANWIVESWRFLRFEERPSIFPPDSSAFESVRRWGGAANPPGVDEDCWIDRREEWWSRHFLLAGSDGAHFPNVALVRSGEWLSVEWSKARFASEPAPEFLARSGQELVPWVEAEQTLAEFVAFVASWLREENLGDLYSWVRNEDPLRELQPDLLRALEVYTARSPSELVAIAGAGSVEELPDLLGLRGDARDPAGSVIAQTLRDLPPTLSPGLSEVIRTMEGRTRDREGRPPNLDLRDPVREAARSASSPESAGYEAAREARSLLQLDGQPIDDLEALLSSLSIRLVDSRTRCASERMLVGSREDGSAIVIINDTPRTTVPWGKRFETARALGYLLVAPYRGGALGGASTPFSQPWLRRCSGTFAAELLLPGDSLAEEYASATDDESRTRSFRGVMKKYGVGARTTAYQLWNRGLLASVQERDELVERFAADR